MAPEMTSGAAALVAAPAHQPNRRIRAYALTADGRTVTEYNPTYGEGCCGHCGGTVRVTWARTADIHNLWRTGTAGPYQTESVCPGSYEPAVKM